MRELNDRLREHLDGAAPPIDIDQLVGILVAEGRTDDMPVTTLEPEHEIRPPARRRIRFGVVFAAAVIVTIAAIGVSAWLFGGADVVGDPADVPVTVQPTAPEPTLGATQPPATAELPQTTVAPPPPPQAVVVPLDPTVDLDWAQPSMILGADEAPRVLYQRDDTTVAYATCEGLDCAAPTVTDIYSAGGRLGWLVGTPREEHGPVFWMGGSSSLVVCPDQGCSAPEIVRLRNSEQGVSLPAVVVTPAGAPLATWVDRSVPMDVTIYGCADPTCTGAIWQHAAWTANPEQFVDGTAVSVGDGGPVVAARIGTSLLLGTCREADCRPGLHAGESGFESLVEVPVTAPIFRDPKLQLREDGSPVAVMYLEAGRFEDVVAIVCEAPECAEPQIATFATVDDGFSEWDMALGADGRLRVAWTDQGSLWLATCADEMCTSFDVVEVAHPARDVAIVVGADGNPILATSSPDRGVELIICKDEACTFEP